jgi:polar amino acid transport system substrate-binding protein
MRAFPRAGIALALTAALALAACSSAPPIAPGAGQRAEPPLPVGVQDPAVVPSATAAPPASCDPRASLRPPETLPSPGQMPAGSTMARIVQRGRIIIGVDQNNYLFGFRDPDSNELTGFEISLARELAQAVFGRSDNRVVQFRALTTAERVKAIQDGTVDLVVRSMTMTCERLNDVAFSTEYLSAGQRILVRKDSKAARLSDLAGQKVCAAAGSTSIRNVARATPPVAPVTAADALDCLVMLQQNQVAAVSTDDSILAGFAAQDPNTKVVGPRFSEEPYGIAMKKDATDLVRFVNGVLQRIRADGTWTALYGQWLTAALGPAPQPPTARYRD